MNKEKTKKKKTKTEKEQVKIEDKSSVLSSRGNKVINPETFCLSFKNKEYLNICPSCAEYNRSCKEYLQKISIKGSSR